MCHGLATQMGLATSGRRCQVCNIEGPRNEENLNGGHPALTVGCRCNNNVQVGYRLDVTPETHSRLCKAGCTRSEDYDAVLRSAQRDQDAQLGYACDYTTKGNPIGTREVKAFAEGHKRLACELQDSKPTYVFSRHCKRILSDLYGNGVTRGAVEDCNLRTQSRTNAVTAAEFFNLKNAHQGGFEFDDATAMYVAYSDELFKFDQLYRHREHHSACLPLSLTTGSDRQRTDG